MRLTLCQHYAEVYVFKENMTKICDNFAILKLDLRLIPQTDDLI